MKRQDDAPDCAEQADKGGEGADGSQNPEPAPHLIQRFVTRSGENSLEVFERNVLPRQAIFEDLAERGLGVFAQDLGLADVAVGQRLHDGAREVALPILAATLTTVIVFIPFVYLQGELRIYYIPLALVVGMSLFASLFVAFTFIPSLAAKVLGSSAERRNGGTTVEGHEGQPGSPLTAPGSREEKKPPFYVRIYAGMVGFTLKFPVITVILALSGLGGSYYLFNKYVTRGVLWTSWWGQQTYIQIVIRQRS